MSLIVFLLIAAVIIDVYVMVFSITRKDNARSVYLVTLAGGAALYAVGEILLQMSGATESAVNALIVANMGIPMIAPSLLLLYLSLFQPKYLKPWSLPVAVIYGLLMFFCIMFNENHHLYYSVIEFREAGNYVHIERGVLFWVNQAVAVLCLIPAYIILFGRFIKGNNRLRGHMIYIGVGSLLVFSANIVNFTNIISDKIDPTPLVIAVALIFCAIDLSRYGFWDIIAVAADTAFETMEDAMIILDNDWYFLSCNDSAKDLFPSLRSLECLIEPDPITKAGEWPSELKNTDKLNEIVFELDRTEPYSQKCTYRANTNKIIDRRGSQIGWHIVIHDITSITFLVNQLENLATTDSLTGIANRRHFLERVYGELDRSSPARLNMSNALIMYDIDLFKKVNDTYGHAAGDYILCAVVETVKRELRSYDIIARYGGEEFVIFTPSSDNEESLYKFAFRLCRLIEASKFIYEGKHIPVTASFGAVQVNPGDSFDEAMLAVDEAMYKAKHSGRNQVVIGKIKKDASMPFAWEE